MTEPPNTRADGAENAERDRIGRILLERGLPPVEITEKLIDFWIVQAEKDEEEGRSLGYRPPSFRWFIGSGN